jgi:hypothetical protein
LAASFGIHFFMNAKYSAMASSSFQLGSSGILKYCVVMMPMPFSTPAGFMALSTEEAE